jgi:alkanesulfonate monooxygenase SsuD/methylene tetrahydromethanopterin reductase-like flavin-dependent oxidoreductase (luciferase family)
MEMRARRPFPEALDELGMTLEDVEYEVAHCRPVGVAAEVDGSPVGWPSPDLAEWIRVLRDRAVHAGRDPSSMIVASQQACLLALKQEDAEARMVAHRKSLAATGRKLTDALDNMLVGTSDNVRAKIERLLKEAGADEIASITFTVQSVDEYLQQLHMFAEEVMVPYRRDHRLPQGSTRVQSGPRV